MEPAREARAMSEGKRPIGKISLSFTQSCKCGMREKVYAKDVPVYVSTGPPYIDYRIICANCKNSMRFSWPVDPKYLRGEQ